MNARPGQHGTVTPALLHAWLAARSIARGLPAPVADHGGYRVDTRSETEYCRWVFAAPSAEIPALAQGIYQPGRFIKLCDSAECLRALLPPSCQLHAPTYFMQAGEWRIDSALPAGYHCKIEADGAAMRAIILDETGEGAAFGYAGETADAFVYDRIVTAPEHRRKRLGTIVMAALHAARTRTDTPELLVATEDGRQLYQQLGWRVLSPYTTASIPAE